MGGVGQEKGALEDGEGVDRGLMRKVESIRLDREVVWSRVPYDSQSGFIACQVDVLCIYN